MVGDYYSVSQEAPPEDDAPTAVKLLSAEATGTAIRVTFSRPFDAQDAQDRVNRRPIEPTHSNTRTRVPARLLIFNFI